MQSEINVLTFCSRTFGDEMNIRTKGFRYEFPGSCSMVPRDISSVCFSIFHVHEDFAFVNHAVRIRRGHCLSRVQICVLENIVGKHLRAVDSERI